jgi:uncharacterized protein YfdQ (DUF2303 family)
MDQKDFPDDTVRSIAHLARVATPVSVVRLQDGREFAVLLNGATGQQSLQELTSPGFRHALPDHIEERVTLTSKDSFVEYVQGYATPTARMFAHLDDKGGGSITCDLDYHVADDAAGRGTEAEKRSLSPGRRKHSAKYELRDSEEWTRWSGISGKLQPQAKFLRWLEENAADITAPDGATILELVQDFSVKRKVDFRSAVRLQNGDTSFEYTQTAEANSKTGEIAVPSKFQLTIPVFFGEPSINVHAFLRYDIEEGLKLGIELHRPLYVRQAVFQQIAGDITDRTSVPLHYGSASSR